MVIGSSVMVHSIEKMSCNSIVCGTGYLNSYPMLIHYLKVANANKNIGIGVLVNNLIHFH